MYLNLQLWSSSGPRLDTSGPTSPSRRPVSAKWLIMNIYNCYAISLTMSHPYSTPTVHLQYTYSTPTVHLQYTYSTPTVQYYTLVCKVSILVRILQLLNIRQFRNLFGCIIFFLLFFLFLSIRKAWGGESTENETNTKIIAWTAMQGNCKGETMRFASNSTLSEVGIHEE